MNPSMGACIGHPCPQQSWERGNIAAAHTAPESKFRQVYPAAEVLFIYAAVAEGICPELLLPTKEHQPVSYLESLCMPDIRQGFGCVLAEY